MTASRRASLLVVLAHPDDEIFHGGMLMHLGHRAGVFLGFHDSARGERQRRDDPHALAAFFSSGAMGAAAPERLFYGTMRRDVFCGLADASRGRGIMDGPDPDVFGTAAEMIAAVSADFQAWAASQVHGG
jgi:hypothetical protein